MESNSKAARLRVYISSTDKVAHTLISENLVQQAHHEGLAGVTVIKGIIGYGASSVIHSYKYWEVSDKVPVVVEIIDEETRVRKFYETIQPLLEMMRYGCLVTIDPVEVLLCKPGLKKAQ